MRRSLSGVWMWLCVANIKKRKENIYEQQDKADKRRSEMQKFLKKYGYDVGRKHAGHLIYEKDGVPYKASIGNHKPMNKGFQRRIMKEAAAAASTSA